MAEGAEVGQPVSSSLEIPWGYDLIQRLHREEATGILRFRNPLHTHLDIYLMDGQVIGTTSPADVWLLGRLLLCGRAAEASALERAVGLATDAASLAELLLEGALVSPETLQNIQAERFRENVYAACAFSPGDGGFEVDESVFPPEVQLGVQTDRLVEEAILWFNLVQPLWSMSGVVPSPVFQLVPDRRINRPRAGAALLALLRDGPLPLDDLLARSPLSGVRTLEALAILAADELVSQVEVTPPAVPSFFQTDESSVEEDAPPVIMEEATPSPAVVDVERLQVDYDAVTRGHFVHSYDVLDVVDMTGIEHLTPMADGEPMEVAVGGAESGEGDESGEGEVERSFFETSEPPVIDQGLDDVLALPLGHAVRNGADFLDDETQIEVHEEDSGIHRAVTPEELTARAQSSSLRNLVGSLGEERFDARTLQGFADRIDIFNSIFQIIFRTFASQIGPERTIERFNHFLSDESLQYPALFRGLHPENDGALPPEALVRNLAQSPLGDPAAFLHQGLYELIYVHLYDAKDLLPPDVERDMMDQIDAFEQRLHTR